MKTVFGMTGSKKKLTVPGKTGNKFFDEMVVKKISNTTTLPVVGRPVHASELHLAHRRLKKLEEFENFPFLQVAGPTPPCKLWSTPHSLGGSALCPAPPA